MAGRAATRCARASARTTASTSNPSLKIPHTSSLYEYALHFLPLKEIDAIAARMTDEGLARYDGGKGDDGRGAGQIRRRQGRSALQGLARDAAEGSQVDWCMDVLKYILAFPIEL